MKTIIEICKVKDLRKKLGFVFLMLFLFKVGTYIVVPGIDSSFLNQLNQDGGMLGLANLMSGGALQNFSLFAVGIMPYITASIIVQLLQMDVLPTVAEWKKQGENGQKKTKKLTKILAVFMALIQSFGMSFSFNKMYPGLVENPSIKTYVLITLVLTLGTIILMVMGELIDKKGIGQGTSIIITAGIMMGIPNVAVQYYVSDIQNADSMFLAVAKIAIILILLAVLIIGVIYIHRAERRIPIQYSNQSQGNYRSILPIKINAAGVLPVIFSMSILMFPVTIAQFFSENQVAQFIIKHFSYTSVSGMLINAILIILFAYFYAFVQVNPEQLADNLKKSGGFVPGIRPGNSTKIYISKILSRLTLIGALFLAVLTILPVVVGMITSLPQQIQIGGTSLIILVGVTLDLSSAINSHLIDRKYTSFLSSK